MVFSSACILSIPSNKNLIPAYPGLAVGWGGEGAAMLFKKKTLTGLSRTCG
jgi:hypothetical protein